MNSRDDEEKKRLIAKITAQQKTIEVLMDTVEQYGKAGTSSLELLSENLNLERVVKRKTEILQQQGEKLQKALHELQLTQGQLVQASKLESVGQLAAGIAHEINTPTQFIGSNIEFLDDSFSGVQRLMTVLLKQLQRLTDDTNVSQFIEHMEKTLDEVDWHYLREEIPIALGQSREGIQRISTIVQAMKEFSHPSSKDMAEVDINRLINTTVTVARNEWKYCAEMYMDLDKTLPRLCCLTDEVGQVILNILVNAAHAIEEKMATGDHQEKGRITIATRHDEQCVEIRISDTGIGMTQNIQERVFDPFFTTKSVGRGTGQGLAIAHNVIVTTHGGTLTCESAPQKGSTFTIRLPLASPHP